ncbi:UDP-N-acetylmuramate dehydrogenase [Leuconostocaceae bacterium ESL0958]|nr:UDP-N-acetylmuramate dehydrogenase [Leuconostocaceae bacterium ESL0958]
MAELPDMLFKKEAIAPYAYTQVGGPADYLAKPETVTALMDLLAFAREQGWPTFVLGRLSNLVVRSGGLRGLVILTTALKSIRQEGQQLIAEAGCDFIWLAAVAQRKGLTGLEWAAGIPGTVGGAVFMNAGAYGGQTDQVVTAVKAVLANGQVRTFSGEALAFGYRHSVFQENGATIIEATFSLQKGDPKAIQALMDQHNYARASKQPLNLPSNGSVFKRPEGYFAGKLIMDTGLQGTKVGGAMVSTKHAGFMVNVGQAEGNDYEDLIHLVQGAVHDRYGVDLETEVRILGER